MLRWEAMIFLQSIIWVIARCIIIQAIEAKFKLSIFDRDAWDIVYRINVEENQYLFGYNVPKLNEIEPRELCTLWALSFFTG